MRLCEGAIETLLRGGDNASTWIGKRSAVLQVLSRELAQQSGAPRLGI
jgi:hypothetical protein